MEVKPQNYSIIEKSKEQKYPGALIVIETDEPIVAAPFPVQNIQRYWYDEETNKVTKETLLALDTPESFIINIQVLDDLVIYMEGDTVPQCTSGVQVAPSVTRGSGQKIMVKSLSAV